MMKRRRASVALALGLATSTALAAEQRPFTVDTMWAVKRVGVPLVSPDGTQVVYSLGTYDSEENRILADLWMVPVAGGTPRRLTANRASDGSPDFSPDGSRLVFVSKRDADKAAQLYLLPLSGGEPERLTDLPMDVATPRFLPDGKRILFASHVVAGAESPEETKKALEAREKNKVKARVTENRLFRFWDRWLTDEEYPHLFVLDLETRKVTDLLPGSKRLFGLQGGEASFDVSPDGTLVVFEANASEAPYKVLNTDVFVVPTAGGTVRNLTVANAAQDSDPVWSPDGKTIAYGLEKKADGWPDHARLGVIDIASGRATVLTEPFDATAGAWQWSPDGSQIVFTAEVKARTSLYAVPAAGGAVREVHRGGNVAGPAVTRDGQVVFQRSDLNRPPEIAAVKLDGSGFRYVTTTNDGLVADTAVGAVKEMTFKGAIDDDVQMFVVYPPGFDEKKKYPLVQMIHGGPVGTFGDSFSFRWNPHAFAAPGYVVALVNFHGSSSFGQPWIESILGAHPDKPFTDVMKATDHLIALGYIDSTRMAAAGGSYGGFLVNWIEGHTDRFKALVSHAGVYSLLGQSASDTSYGRQHSYGGYPFTNLANVERWSPNRFAAGFKTPMLVLHGERDYRVPVGQGLELYGVLTSKGVPARLVYYPDENHWILKGQNSKHWYGEVLGWLARWLK
jgi:dipeptidyl aminopeptidase/acylaminoacyl peptidase